jgi:tRNA U34 5-methylaminomethyl-2-thiouridine-forming methyltransferase MnmC
MHVFIDSGLKSLLATHQRLQVFEMGFGTGLNALLTLLYAEKEKKKIYYKTVEAFPLEESIVNKLNYCSQLNRPDLQFAFEQLHSCSWEKDITIVSDFNLHKVNADFTRYSTKEQFHLIYYDAFDPGAQPGLWTLSIFSKLFKMLIPGGYLLTYCSKGIVRRAMQEAGFVVEKLPGPPHKREMMRGCRR